MRCSLCPYRMNRGDSDENLKKGRAVCQILTTEVHKMDGTGFATVPLQTDCKVYERWRRKKNDGEEGKGF